MQFVSAGRKRYRFRIGWGVATDTEDREGAVTDQSAVRPDASSIAAAAVIPTVLTGWLAWHFVLEDQKIKGLLLLHLLAASTATLLVIASWWVHWRIRNTPMPLPRYRIPLELLGVAAIGLTAHLGGFLSGVNS